MDEARQAEIADTYAAGLSALKVATMFGCKPALVLKLARERGVPIRGQGGQYKAKAFDRQNEIVTFHDGGARSLREVGEQFGITRERARQILVRAGVDVRSPDVRSAEREAAVREAEEMFAAGISLRVVSGRLRVAQATLALWCRKAGVVTPGMIERINAARERRSQMAARYAAGGVTVAEVASEFGVSAMTVNRGLAENGVTSNRNANKAALASGHSA